MGQIKSTAQSPTTHSPRLAELIAALSLATDLGMGQPMELALRVALLGVDLGRSLGLEAAVLSDIYYLALVEHIGCTADSLEFAAFAGGDDNAFRSHAMVFPAMSRAEVLRTVIGHIGEGRPFRDRARLVAAMLVHADEQASKVATAHCEAGSRFAERLGLSDGVLAGLLQEQERWDGKGRPAGLAGKALSPAKRVVLVAHDALVLSQAEGNVLATMQSRRGRAYDPEVLDALVAAGGPPAVEPEADVWARALAAEPPPLKSISQSGIDRVALACADFTDLKSPYLLGHSTRVAELASGGAEVLGSPRGEVEEIRRAALLHDLGRVGVHNGIWDKKGPLAASETERVRLHPYYTERILARSSMLAPLAVAAGSHHENLDGGGYHRGVGASQLGRTARLLRAADCFDALGSDRPHRPALATDERVRLLRREVEAGRLDAEAVAAVIEASGGGRVRLRPQRPAGLSEREIEVLRLVVHGLSNAQIAARLHVSPKTVGHHVEHIYDKAGVGSRAAVALFAMETGLT